MNFRLRALLKNRLQLLCELRVLEHRHAAGPVEVGLGASALKGPMAVFETLLALGAGGGGLVGYG